MTSAAYHRPRDLGRGLRCASRSVVAGFFLQLSSVRMLGTPAFALLGVLLLAATTYRFQRMDVP